VHLLLRFKIITEHFNGIIRSLLLSEAMNAELIILKYLGKERLYLPSNLTELNKIELLEKYIKSSSPNINVLRKIITFPPNKMLNIPDKIRLNAKKRVTKEKEKFFTDGAGIKSEIRVSYSKDQIEEIKFKINEDITSVIVSKSWIENNLDYPTLWNNFIHLFGFVDSKVRLMLDAKISEIGTF